MALPALAGLVFLLLAGPIAVYVAWSDMAWMKITNQSVVATFIVFALAGSLVLPLSDYAWAYLHLVVVLVIGFVLNVGGLVGAGDAKYAAAMAPFVAWGDIAAVVLLFAAVLIGAFVTHRIARAFPRLRAAVPNWESWTSGDFPMGLANAQLIGGALNERTEPNSRNSWRSCRVSDGVL